MTVRCVINVDPVDNVAGDEVRCMFIQSLGASNHRHPLLRKGCAGNASPSTARARTICGESGIKLLALLREDDDMVLP
jgi:hypothetical protein